MSDCDSDVPSLGLPHGRRRKRRRASTTYARNDSPFTAALRTRWIPSLCLCALAWSSRTTHAHGPIAVTRHELRGGAWRPQPRTRVPTLNTTTAASTDHPIPPPVPHGDSPPVADPPPMTWGRILESLRPLVHPMDAQWELQARAAQDPRRTSASARGGAMVQTATPKTPLETAWTRSWMVQWRAMEAAAAAAVAARAQLLDDQHRGMVRDPEENPAPVLGEVKEESARDTSRRQPAKDMDPQLRRQGVTNRRATTQANSNPYVHDSESEDDHSESADETDLPIQDPSTGTIDEAVRPSEPATTVVLDITDFSLPEPSKASTESPFVSSGYWTTIDRVLTLGMGQTHPEWRVSTKLRRFRKWSARQTGMHGLLSGKPHTRAPVTGPRDTSDSDDDAQLGAVRRRLAAIATARENLARWSGTEALAAGDVTQRRRTTPDSGYELVMKQSRPDIQLEKLRKERVREIDALIAKSQKLLQDLACEKDVLQRRHNPLWNYTAHEDTIQKSLTQNQSLELSESTDINLVTAREFSFPPPDLVDEYLDMLFSSGRIVKLNHTDLWRSSDSYLDEDDDDDDELSSPTRNDDTFQQHSRPTMGGSGSWLLRNGIGEKIGEAAETAGYKAVCQAVMSVLARGLSALHGVNLMKYSDIALSMESAPDLPPLAAGIIPSSGKSTNYAQGAIERAMKRGARKRKVKRRRGTDFIQRDAVVETLLSHCQISAPLLTLFPIAWQRALLGNIITLVAAVISDFFEGVELQILGHRLSFSFQPISESDLLRHLGTVGDSFYRRHRPSPELFEAAVQATATDLAENLKFLDRWHERALGSGLLRQQIANLIARVVLTLADDVLRGARMDLWTAQAGGPRLIAGLEYRE